MKKVLILVLSTEKDWYPKLAEASRQTWDSVDVPGVETIFYFAESSKPNDYKTFYAPCDDDFWSMGKKTLLAFDHALANREFDFIFRANASLYVDKAGLLKYVQGKSDRLALGVLGPGSRNGEQFMFLWGPGFLLSRDVVQLICDNRHLWDHKITDDNAISLLLRSLEIELDGRGSMASLAIKENGRECIFYENGSGGGVFAATMREVVDSAPNQWCFRVKDDSNRDNDIKIMRELHAAFQENS